MSTIYDDGWEYDALVGDIAAPSEVGFYRAHIADGDTALELACGTGRLTRPLAQAGVSMVGLDLSPSMLEVARAKAAAAGVPPNFVEGDARQFSLGGSFGAILLPNNSLGHLHSLSDIQGCFSCVRRHLCDRGRFLVEMFNPSLALLRRVPGEHYPVGEYESPGGRVVVTETVEYDAAAQMSRALWHFRREDGQTRVRPLDLRIFFPQELDALLTLSGFEIEAKYGDYSGAPFTGGARQQLLVCRKA